MNLTIPAIKPAYGAPDPGIVAADLRTIADAVENNPLLAALIAMTFETASLLPKYAANSEHWDTQSREVMAEVIRALKPIASGPVDKKYSGELFYAIVPMQAIKLRLVDKREDICTRVVTGTETVTEEIPDPKYIAAAPKITQTREVEIVEWKCEPLMKAAE